MQQLNNNKISKQGVGVKNSLPNIVIFSAVAGFKDNIGSSDSGTSVSDYIEKATKPVGRFDSVYDYKLQVYACTMSVSNVKNHNSRPEIVHIFAESVRSEDSITAVKSVQGRVKVK